MTSYQARSCFEATATGRQGQPVVDRRQFQGGLVGFACAVLTPLGALAQGGGAISRDESIARWRRRISDILAGGDLPIIDTQATYVNGQTNIPNMMRRMDELRVSQIAFAAANAPASDPSLALHRRHPSYFVPTTNSGEFQRWWRNPQQFLSGVAHELESGLYFLMGEYEFRHYPSPEQIQADRADRDISIDLDGPAGRALFELSERTGVAFQLHYEIEDGLLPALETMLSSHPGATVIWCHLGMIRYPDRAATYGPDYVQSLIDRFPGLYFDLAVPEADHVYTPSGARESTIYDESGELNAHWREILDAYPERFLAASDYRPQVEAQYAGQIRRRRKLLMALSPPAQKLIAFGNAWRLMTGAEWDG